MCARKGLNMPFPYTTHTFSVVSKVAYKHMHHIWPVLIYFTMKTWIKEKGRMAVNFLLLNN